MKLSHLAIGCADIDKMTDYYTRVVGLPEAFRMKRDDGSTGIVYLDAGNSTFVELLNRGGEVETGGRTGLAHVCLEVEDLEAELVRLKDLGVEPTIARKMGADGNLQAWIEDPEGGRIELMQLAEDGLQKKYLAATSS